MTLRGRTPDEVYLNLRAANTLPRLEPRPKVRHSTPCAKPRAMMAGKAGRHADVRLSFLEGRPHLPILSKPFRNEDLDWFIAKWEKLQPENISIPTITPTPEGRLWLEWSFGCH